MKGVFEAVENGGYLFAGQPVKLPDATTAATSVCHIYGIRVIIQDRSVAAFSINQTTNMQHLLLIDMRIVFISPKQIV